MPHSLTSPPPAGKPAHTGYNRYSFPIDSRFLPFIEITAGQSNAGSACNHRRASSTQVLQSPFFPFSLLVAGTHPETTTEASSEAFSMRREASASWRHWQWRHFSPQGSDHPAMSKFSRFSPRAVVPVAGLGW